MVRTQNQRHLTDEGHQLSFSRAVTGPTRHSPDQFPLARKLLLGWNLRNSAAIALNGTDRKRFVISVAIIGMGPRGTSVLERIVSNASNLAFRTPIVIHVFDNSSDFGSGSVWVPTQPQALMMNTVTSQVSLFTDQSVVCEGPIVTGPNLYEWITSGLGHAFLQQFPHLMEESATLGPDDYPSRALCGAYYNWFYQKIRDEAPPGVDVVEHHVRVDDLAKTDDYWCVGVEGSHTIEVDSVVLALGHTSSRQSSATIELRTFAKTNGLTYIPPSSPSDNARAVEAIPAGSTVILRGLGLCFFDYLSLLTTARGGSFVRRLDGELEYVRSGHEPTIVGGSRRGVPHHARGSNEKGVSGRVVPRFLTQAVLDEMLLHSSSDRPLNFMRDIWPLVSAEVEFVYYSTWLKNAGLDVSARSIVDIVGPGAASKQTALAQIGVPIEQQWKWSKVLNPCSEPDMPDLASFTRWLTIYLRDDFKQALVGNISNPLKAAVDALRDLRNEIRQVVDHGAISATSYRQHLAGWYSPLNAFLSIGPPAQRIEELIALLNAGVTSIVGPNMQVEPDDCGTFYAYSPLIPDSGYQASTLIEARLHTTNWAQPTDSLMKRLLDSGIARQHELKSPGFAYKTGSLDLTRRPYRVVSSAGIPHDRLFAFGVPSEGVHWATAAGARPGVGSVTFSDADSIARASIGLLDSTPQSCFSTTRDEVSL